MLKNITISRVYDVKSEKMPTHNIIALDSNYENKTFVGALWTKMAKDKNGNDYKFLSGSLQKERKAEDGKVFEGYVLVTEKEYAEYMALKNNHKSETKVEYVEGAVDLSSIPF